MNATREEATPELSGNDIKEIRKALGLYQWELARRLGVHPITIATWECGSFVPNSSAKVLLEIARTDPCGFLKMTEAFA